jgi:ribA/ribD-fused uncharacterized protein
MSEPVLFYGGEFGFGFSNFASFAVTWRGRWAMTSEHHYQASKFLDEDIINEIYAANSAYDALKLARKYEAEGKLRPDWTDELKLEIMYDIISHKHDQHPYIQKQLRESIGRELIEDSAKDAFWGRGPDWKGQNWLGKLWMRLRDELYQASC